MKKIIKLRPSVFTLLVTAFAVSGCLKNTGGGDSDTGSETPAGCTSPTEIVNYSNAGGNFALFGTNDLAAQSFLLGADTIVDSVGTTVANPTGGATINVQIYTNTGGDPDTGTVVGQGSLVIATTQPSQTDRVIELDSQVTLTGASTYWLVFTAGATDFVIINGLADNSYATGEGWTFDDAIPIWNDNSNVVDYNFVINGCN